MGKGALQGQQTRSQSKGPSGAGALFSKQRSRLSSSDVLAVEEQGKGQQAPGSPTTRQPPARSSYLGLSGLSTLAHPPGSQVPCPQWRGGGTAGDP